MLVAVSLRRFAGLSRLNQRLLVGATLVLAIVSAGVLLLPFRRAIILGSRARGARRGAGPIEARQIAWSVQRVAAAVPWRAVCLQQGLAAQWLLRRHGFDARLHYGIGKDQRGGLAAHVWVTVDDTVLIGAEGSSAFAEVAVYPSVSAVS